MGRVGRGVQQSRPLSDRVTVEGIRDDHQRRADQPEGAEAVPVGMRNARASQPKHDEASEHAQTHGDAEGRSECVADRVHRHDRTPVVFDHHRLGQRGRYGRGDEGDPADEQHAVHSGSFRWLTAHDERGKREPADDGERREQAHDSQGLSEPFGACGSWAAPRLTRWAVLGCSFRFRGSSATRCRRRRRRCRSHRGRLFACLRRGCRGRRSVVGVDRRARACRRLLGNVACYSAAVRGFRWWVCSGVRGRLCGGLGNWNIDRESERALDDVAILRRYSPRNLIDAVAQGRIEVQPPHLAFG